MSRSFRISLALTCFSVVMTALAVIATWRQRCWEVERSIEIMQARLDDDNPITPWEYR